MLAVRGLLIAVAFSCLRAQALGAGFSSLVGGTWAQQCAHGLSCPATCGISLGQGSNPHLLYWQADSLPLGHQGSPIFSFLRNLHTVLHRRRQWHPTPVLLPGKSHGRRSMVGCSPWGREEWDTTERLHFHFSLSCIGERNGNPLQCSFLENPRDGRAWWAAVYGVAQSQTRLKQLSSLAADLLRRRGA